MTLPRRTCTYAHILLIKALRHFYWVAWALSSFSTITLTLNFIYLLFQNNAKGGYNVGDKTASAMSSEETQFNMVNVKI